MLFEKLLLTSCLVYFKWSSNCALVLLLFCETIVKLFDLYGGLIFTMFIIIMLSFAQLTGPSILNYKILLLKQSNSKISYFFDRERYSLMPSKLTPELTNSDNFILSSIASLARWSIWNHNQILDIQSINIKIVIYEWAFIVNIFTLKITILIFCNQ